MLYLLFTIFLMMPPAFAQQRSPQAKIDSAREIEAMIERGEFVKAEAAARALVAEIDADNRGEDSVELAEALSVLVDCFYRTSRVKDPAEHAIADRALAV